MIPPPYPRIAHLVPGRGTRDDLVLGAAERTELLRRPVVVEEKLDGANVVLWWGGRWVECALRSGPGAQDRAGQLGPLRPWVAEHVDGLQPLLAGGAALYGEWLLLTHSIAYDRLPSFFVGLDVRRPDGEFEPVDVRNHALQGAGLAAPPELFRGVLGSVEEVETFVGSPSPFGAVANEGVVIRTIDGREPRIVKLLAPEFSVLHDDAWQSGRPKNRLVEATWR
jgi:atypical dual specificity phosphatase